MYVLMIGLVVISMHIFVKESKKLLILYAFKAATVFIGFLS
jgi:hypothetical protein